MNSSGDMTAAFTSALESAGAEPVADTSPVSTPTDEGQSIAVEPTEATAAAIAQPVEQAQAADSVTEEPAKTGEPPKWRWQDILKNAREEERQRARQEVEQQYAWAKAVSDEERQFLAWKARDPHAAQAWLAQQQGQAKAPVDAGPTADPEPEPDAAIRLDNGQTVPVYTPEGKRHHDAWLRRNLSTELKSEFQKEFQPLVETTEQLRQYREQVQAQQASQQWAGQVLAPIVRLPYFEEFKPELGKALAALPPTATNDEMTAAVYDTYARLHTTKLESLTTSKAATAVATMQSRAIAGTGNPGTASTAPPKTFAKNAQGFEDALAHFGSGS